MSEFIGRDGELLQLEKCYKVKNNAMVVLYGREGVGKTTLVRKFVENKTYVYYKARELSELEQTMYFNRAKKELLEKTKMDKVCFIIDEVDLMLKGYKNFFADFLEFMRKLPKDRVLIILTSSSIQWVENSMVDDMGVLARAIAVHIKLKEFSFIEMVERFPDLTTEECVMIYGIFGGVPAYLDLWNTKETVRKNIIRIILSNKGPLHKEVQRFLKTSLRELPYYSTILSVLAEDEPKLNYLYNRTKFSRAKISVYIKNLIQLDIATKIFSYEPEKKQTVQKGLYGITDSFVFFWYKLIYPHISEFSMMEPEDFYATYVKAFLPEIATKSYIKVCREFMGLMNRFGKLPAKFDNFGSLYGKTGFIPIVANGEDKKLLVGSCKWSSKPMDVKEFDELLKNNEQIGKDADYYYLFSKEGFTDELEAMTRNMDNIQLIELEKM